MLQIKKGDFLLGQHCAACLLLKYILYLHSYSRDIKLKLASSANLAGGLLASAKISNSFTYKEVRFTIPHVIPLNRSSFHPLWPSLFSLLG